MTEDLDMTPILERWLKDSTPRLSESYHVFETVGRQIHETPQQRRWWPLSMRGASGPVPTRSFTMFSALKFIAAAVIVALFGGFLLSGVLTTQQEDEAAPAAVTGSPSPMTTEELLSGMVTDEVEPGVHKVVNDGVRALEYPVGGYPGSSLDVTPDGSVWLRGEGGGQGLFRLGDGSMFDDPAELHGSIEIAPDGSLWAIGQYPDDYMSIFSFDGQGWTERAAKTDYTFGFDELAIGPDGTVWVTTTDERKYPGTFLTRLEDDGSLTTVKEWTDVYDGDPLPRPLEVSPDGDVWLIGGHADGSEAEELLRFDGNGWEVIPLPEGFLQPAWGGSFVLDPDGTPWVEVRGVAAGHIDARGLARFDDPGWSVFTEPDDGSDWVGMRHLGGEPAWPGADLLTVTADGSFWLLGRPTEKGCGGVAHFDGTTWTSFLVEACINDLAIAPDGSVWLHGDSLYVITPEAMAAAE